MRTFLNFLGIFQMIVRAMTVVEALMPTVAFATSHEDLPNPTTTTFLPRTSFTSWKSTVCMILPPAARKASWPANVGTAGSLKMPLQTTRKSKVRDVAAPPDIASTVQLPACSSSDA